jgi:hypothetical protein
MHQTPQLPTAFIGVKGLLVIVVAWLGDAMPQVPPGRLCCGGHGRMP